MWLNTQLRTIALSSATECNNLLTTKRLTEFVKLLFPPVRFLLQDVHAGRYVGVTLTFVQDPVQTYGDLLQDS